MKNKTLELTNVLSDPTRHGIYEYIIEATEPVTVKEIAEAFKIHSNVARLHLTKLTEVNIVESFLNDTKRRGRPNRLYTISKEATEISFPYRDYKLLSSITLGAIAKLGEAGKEILFEVGKDYGKKMIENLNLTNYEENISNLEKTKLLTETSNLLGLYATFEYDEKTDTMSYLIKNCPFRELIAGKDDVICHLHHEFLKGMFTELFNEIEFKEITNMFDDCKVCSYDIKFLTLETSN